MIHRKWILHLLAKYGGPSKIKRLGKARVNAFARKHRARNPEPVTDAIFAAIAGQSVQITGAKYAELGVAMSAKDALLKLEHRKEIEAKVTELIDEIPQTQLLLSMPGIEPRSAAQILMTVGDMSDFPTAGHLASYAGLSPKTNQSGTSIMSNSLNRAGNKKLKNAPQAIVFCIDQIPRAFTTILRTKAKRRHNAAVVALARRRLNDLFAMMKNHEFYREPQSEVAAA